MKIVYALLLLTGAYVAASSQSPGSGQTGDEKAPFTLTISAEPTIPTPEHITEPVVMAGSAPVLEIRKTNTSDHEIIKWSMAVTSRGGYIYEMRDSSGNLVEPRKSNTVNYLSGGEERLRGTKDMVLQPGESKIDIAPLGNWYDLSPGTYTIQVSSHTTNDPNSDVVKSNIITVTVIPANSNPTAKEAPATNPPK